MMPLTTLKNKKPVNSDLNVIHSSVIFEKALFASVVNPPLSSDSNVTEFKQELINPFLPYSCSKTGSSGKMQSSFNECLMCVDLLTSACLPSSLPTCSPKRTPSGMTRWTRWGRRRWATPCPTTGSPPLTTRKCWIGRWKGRGASG